MIEVEKDGFVSNQPGPRSRSLALSAGQVVTDLTIQLTPQGFITGKVVDEDGKPVAGLQIRALRSGTQGSSTVADASGGFKLPKLAPGDYYVLAEAPDKEPGSFVRTLFPHGLNFDDASTIPVSAGQTVSDITIRMRKAATYHIRGKISDPPDGSGVQKLRITVLPKVSVDASALLKSAKVNADGTFDMTGLLPGSYTVRLAGQLTGPGSRANRLLAQQDVEIGASDLEGVVLQITPPLVLNGHVAVESESPVNLLRVNLLALPQEEALRGTRVHGMVAADGSFTLTNLDRVFIRSEL